MAKSTKLILANDLHIVDIGHRRSLSTALPLDIGHRRSASAELPPDIGHKRMAEPTDVSPVDVNHPTAILELAEPQFVRRVKAFRDVAGNVHLELEE